MTEFWFGTTSSYPDDGLAAHLLRRFLMRIFLSEAGASRRTMLN